jgi:hypothetical protein
MKVIDDKIYIIEDFISSDTADFLFESFKDFVFPGQEPFMFTGPNAAEGQAYKVSGINKIENYSDNSKRNVALDLLTGTCVSMEKTVSTIHKKELQLKSFLTSFMLPGAFNVVHVDNRSEDEKSDHAGLLYLNDDYEGGELVFPKQSLTYKPKKGTFITFFGNQLLPHGVKKVVNGTRGNIISFYNLKNTHISMEK